MFRTFKFVIISLGAGYQYANSHVQTHRHAQFSSSLSQCVVLTFEEIWFCESNWYIDANWLKSWIYCSSLIIKHWNCETPLDAIRTLNFGVGTFFYIYYDEHMNNIIHLSSACREFTLTDEGIQHQWGFEESFPFSFGKMLQPIMQI